MNCHLPDREASIERYVAGRLSEPARETFELHFLDCDDCATSVQALQVAREVRPAASRKLVWAAAVACLLLAAFTVLYVRNPPAMPVASARPQPSVYDELAKVDAPAYVARTLRGVAGDASFEQAMKLYQQRDYAAVITALKDVDRTDARFYLGASYLITHDNAAAMASLHQVVAAGDTPYLEEAHFYLAKAYLHNHDAASARRELNAAIELRGDLELQARALLARIP